MVDILPHANVAGKPTFIAYIDESGDEGFNVAAGASEWFVLSAVVLRSATERETVKLLDRVRERFYPLPDAAGKRTAPIHFRKLDHNKKVFLVSEIATGRLRTITIFVHKPSLGGPGCEFAEKDRLYFYATRFLVERISWYCRDIRDPRDTGNGTVEIIFSNRSATSYAKMRDYLTLLKSRDDVQIDWAVVKVELIRALPHDQRRGLQIADAVASSHWNAVSANLYGMVETRYAELLQRVVYTRNGNSTSYGLKFFPRGVTKLFVGNPRYEWATNL